MSAVTQALENLRSSVEGAAASMAMRSPAEGWYAAVVTNHELKTSSKGNLMFETTFNLFRDLNDPNSAIRAGQKIKGYKMWTTFPGEGHAQNAREFLTRKVSDFVQAFELDGVTPSSSTSSAVDRQAAVDSAVNKAGEMMAAYESGDVPEELNLVGAQVFVQLRYQRDKEKNLQRDDSGFPREQLTRIAAELPKGAELVDADNAYAVIE